VKFVKWGIFFVLAFLISFILLRTFSQEAFRQVAPARILGYRTPEIPIYYFIAGAFLIGLGIGLVVAIYNYITATAEKLKQSRIIKDQDRRIEELSAQVVQLSPHTDPREITKESFEDTHYRKNFLPEDDEEEENADDYKHEDQEDTDSSGNSEIDSFLN